MSETNGKRMMMTAAVLLLGLVGFVLYAGQGLTNSGKEPNALRMAVDPTVLPPITTDGVKPDESDEEVDSAPVTESVKADEESKSGTSAEAAPEEPAKSQAPETVASETAVQKPQATTPMVGAIQSIVLDSSDTAFSVTVNCSRPVGDTTYMNLKNPGRLVIDLREPWVLQTNNVVRSASGAVKHVVVGKHPDRTRFVVHFRTPPKGKLNPQFIRTGKSLTVSVQMP